MGSDIIDVTTRQPGDRAQQRVRHTVPEVASLLGMSRANTDALLTATDVTSGGA